MCLCRFVSSRFLIASTIIVNVQDSLEEMKTDIEDLELKTNIENFFSSLKSEIESKDLLNKEWFNTLYEEIEPFEEKILASHDDLISHFDTLTPRCSFVSFTSCATPSNMCPGRTARRWLRICGPFTVQKHYLKLKRPWTGSRRVGMPSIRPSAPAGGQNGSG